MSKGRGSGKTPPVVVELLKKAVAEKSQSAVSSESGLGLATINSYLNGVGEPTAATLEKLSVYFGVSVAYLRGEDLAAKLKDKTPENTVLCLRAAVSKWGFEKVAEEAGLSRSILVSYMIGLGYPTENEFKRFAEISKKINDDEGVSVYWLMGLQPMVAGSPESWPKEEIQDYFLLADNLLVTIWSAIKKAQRSGLDKMDRQYIELVNKLAGVVAITPIGLYVKKLSGEDAMRLSRDALKFVSSTNEWLKENKES